MNIFLDIETLPCQRSGFADELLADLRASADEQKAAVRAPSNYKDEAKIAEFIASARQKIDDEIEAEAEKQYRATALDGTFGEVFCVAWAIEDEPVQVGDLPCALTALSAAWDPRDAPCIIGHNVMFDIRFIWQQAILKGLPVPRWWPVKAKPWEDAIYDTMTQWVGVGNRIKLEKLCRAFGIEGKGDLDGSKVYDYWLDGRHDEIRAYCMADVERVRQLHRRMTATNSRAMMTKVAA